MAKITARELAKRLNLSPSAVSLALNGREGVSEETRARVLSAARALGYQPPRLRAVEVSAKHFNICVIYFIDFRVNLLPHSTLASYILQGIEATAERLGCHTDVAYVNADRPIAPQTASILEQADGVIILGTDIVEANLPIARTLIKQLSQVPIVVVDNLLLSDQADCVCNDNVSGARMAIEHLLSQGCRTIGYLRCMPRVQAIKIREDSFKAAMAQHGLTLAPIVDLLPFSGKSFSQFEAWLQANPSLPDAFVADHDELAIAAMQALNSRGISIPNQVALVGFDDSDAGRMMVPPLSSVHTFRQSLGSAAISCLHQRLRFGSNTAVARQNGLLSVAISTQLKIRDSSLRMPHQRNK